ncbi:hypothetical protein H5410_014629 [Solanum commersonii]|uniref:Uncharacterized protein n=1 Tax=Solanum commersonii TaxID=4109 RepID=A0A9J5ZRE5_SOLCO|nr:hypothetical protein H5410_014629 [Solanum commersonii]
MASEAMIWHAPSHRAMSRAPLTVGGSMGPGPSRSHRAIGICCSLASSLEARIATLLHHIRPRMQKSIGESEARVEQDGGYDGRKVQSIIAECL